MANFRVLIWSAVLIIFYLSISVAGLAQSRYDIFFNKNYAERSIQFDTLIFDKYFHLDSMSFNRIMDTIAREAKNNSDYPMGLEVILARYKYTDLNGLTNIDAKIVHLKELLKTVDGHKYAEYHALFMLELANNYLGKKRNYITAFEYYLSTYSIIKDFSPKDFPDKKGILSTIGNAYYRIGDYDGGKKMLLIADETPDSWVPLDNYNCKNTLGLIYREFKQYDSAVYYFKEAAVLAEQNSDSAWVGISNGNIGITYYLQGKYDEALPLLEADVIACIKDGEFAYDNAVNSALIITDIHLKRNNITKARSMLDLIDQYLPITRDRVLLQSKYYPILAKYSYAIGDVNSAYHYKDSAAIYTDSIIKRKNAYELSKIQLRYENDRNEAELMKLNAEKKYIEFMRNGLIAGVVLIFFIALLFINRQRLHYQLKKNNMLAQQKIAERDLSNATKELESFTKHLQDKNTLIEKTTEEIAKLQNALDNTKKSDLNNDVLIQLQASTILTDDEWEEFKILFEQVHKGYLQRLKDKMTDLSPADTRFVVLSKLKLSNKEMAGILGVQPDTIRTYKHRLRKKYNLPDDNSLNEWVNTI